MSTADTVNTWFRERLACGAIARDTEAYNQVVEALPDLVTRLDPPPVAQPAEPATKPARGAAKPAEAETPAAVADPAAETPPIP